jgi:Family of unknown function (DUF6118)
MAGENTDPARAFDDLRAEVSVLRRAVEGLPEAWRENRPPDYSPDLGRMVNALGAVGRHLEAIEKNPMLKIEPSVYRHAVEQAGMAASREMRGTFDSAIREVRAERQQLAGIIGQARARARQEWWLLGVGATCLVVGVLVSPVVASVLPTALGTRIASFIVGEADRWESGIAMMKNARPQNWKNILWEDKIVQANLDRLNECQGNANKKNVPEQCIISVKPDNN